MAWIGVACHTNDWPLSLTVRPSCSVITPFCRSTCATVPVTLYVDDAGDVPTVPVFGPRDTTVALVPGVSDSSAAWRPLIMTIAPGCNRTTLPSANEIVRVAGSVLDTVPLICVSCAKAVTAARLKATIVVRKPIVRMFVRIMSSPSVPSATQSTSASRSGDYLLPSCRDEPRWNEASDVPEERGPTNCGCAARLRMGMMRREHH